jgi:CNT family concentrative nucleoside transporter
VPRSEILPVSRLLATKLIANEFAAYLGSFHVTMAQISTLTPALDLQTIQAGPQPLSPRAFTIATYALCGFANVGSIGIQIGVLSALAPSRGKTIARIATSAMICGFVSTLQTAGIASVKFPSLASTRAERLHSVAC